PCCTLSLCPLSRHSLFVAFVPCDGAHPYLHSFPTRRSSDLGGTGLSPASIRVLPPSARAQPPSTARRHSVTAAADTGPSHTSGRDRKSTRLNSSHVKI